MGNFDFVRATLPTVHTDCARAESYLTADPRSACFYARRAIEGLVNHLYELMALPKPYNDDLAAMSNDAAFRTKVGDGVVAKLNLISKRGNTAVHENRPVAPQAATDALRELFHVMVWAAFHYSTDPAGVPTSSQFDPKLAAERAPLTRERVRQLAEQFRR